MRADRDENSPGWLRDRKARETRNAQRVRAQISALDDDTVFWIEFDSSGPRAFNRILARKVGDGATYRVQLSWQSMVDSPLADLHWKDQSQPYPHNESNETMRLAFMEPDVQSQLVMLLVHKAYDVVRRICKDKHDEALLHRAQAERLLT